MGLVMVAVSLDYENGNRFYSLTGCCVSHGRFNRFAHSRVLGVGLTPGHADYSYQFTPVKRLGEDVISTCAQHVRPEIVIRMTGDDDNRGNARQFPQNWKQVFPGSIRKLFFAKNDRRAVVLKTLSSLFQAQGLFDPPTGVLQNSAYRRTIVFMWADYK